MSKRLSPFLILPLLFACSQNHTESTESEVKTEQYILLGNHDTIEKAIGGDANLALIKKLKYGGVVVSGPESRISEVSRKANASYEKDIVFSVGPEINGKVSGGTPTQTAQVVPWGISKIRGNLVAQGGAGIKVCISDTGIDLTHPDLAANIVGGFNAITPSKTANDDNGHGSHVAGIIAALDNSIGVVGVAPKAQLLAAKGLSRTGSGYSSDLAETIDWCREQGAKVINMSWGSSASNSTIYSAIQRASSAGILLIAAAGNDGGVVGYPAAHPEVVAVSAVDSNELLAYFSNFGSKIENSAPGVDIYSTYKGSTYKSLNGTSMAAPHVSGVAALMLAAIPGAGREHLLGMNIGLPADKQGSRGRIDAVLSSTP